MVAISGAAGFLGTHLVRGFDARGVRVLPLVRVVKERSPAGARVLEEVCGDPSALVGVDSFVHAAAARVRHGVDAPAAHAANVDGVEHAMRACASAGVRRFVFVSCVGVYGFPARLPVTEEHPCCPAYSILRDEGGGRDACPAHRPRATPRALDRQASDRLRPGGSEWHAPQDGGDDPVLHLSGGRLRRERPASCTRR